MTTKEMATKLLFGETIFIKDDAQAKEVQIMLRQAKENATEVLKQLSERFKKK
jgi:hypothetical protein